MSIGAGGSTSEQSSTPSDINFLNPIAAVVANMFGIPVSLTPEGGMKLGGGSTTIGKDKPKSAMELFASSPGGLMATGGMSHMMDPKSSIGGQYGKDRGWGDSGPGVGGDSSGWVSDGNSGGGGGGFEGHFANQVFGPGSFEPIADFLNMRNQFAGDVGQLGSMGGAAAMSGIENMGDMSDALMALPGQVGKPIDIEPIVNRVSRDLAEEYASSGGFSGSDFSNASMRAGSELAVGEEQAALGRLMESTLGAAPMVGQLGTMASDLGTRSAGNLLGLGEQYNMSSATSAGRASSLLQMLAGITPTGAVPRGNYSQGSSKGGDASLGLPIG